MDTLRAYWLRYLRLFRRKDSYLARVGWLSSARSGKPVDADGQPIPWMNYPVSAFLRDRLRADLDLFEYGSGQSTHFFAGRVKSVTSVEYDRHWYETVSAGSAKNVRVLFRDSSQGDGYAASIHETQQPFDVVIIDGANRTECLAHATSALTPRGVVVLDDSDRPEYLGALEQAQNLGFRTLDFEGLKPCNHKLYRSTVLYRDGNCLGL
ncbi:hypothetical protein ACNSTU_09435 [Aquisalimonas sp. APHAB1-3]|uniref:hypothetical protein n=1 Tax=Aquisalimonas sp. APHAB1-3 TaxID=3402080 RepID=UPI003AAB43EA